MLQEGATQAGEGEGSKAGRSSPLQAALGAETHIWGYSEKPESCCIGAAWLTWEQKKTNKQKTHKHFSDGPCGTIVPGTNPHPSQGQTGQNGDFTVELNRERPVCPRTGPILSRGGVPFVPRTVPVCPGHCPAENVYVYWFFSCPITHCLRAAGMIRSRIIQSSKKKKCSSISECQHTHSGVLERPCLLWATEGTWRSQMFSLWPYRSSLVNFSWFSAAKSRGKFGGNFAGFSDPQCQYKLYELGVLYS